MSSRNFDKPRGSDNSLVSTLRSIWPLKDRAGFASIHEFLGQSPQASEMDRFYHKHVGPSGLAANLYLRDGNRVETSVLRDDTAAFPPIMRMPDRSSGASAFVVSEGRLYFLFDVTGTWHGAPADLALVAVRIDPSDIPNLNSDDDPAPTLSDSEYRLLAHLLSGQNLKRAATELSASYDTKRKQVQVVLQKFGAESQTALIRGLTMRITTRILGALLTSRARREESALVKRQFAAGVAVNVLSLDGGAELPVWEFGARQGRPVLHFHNMLVPVIFRDDLDAVLRRHGLRWLVVPRQFVDVAAADEPGLRLAELTRSLSQAVGYLTDGPVICLGESAGVSWAVHFARHNPGKCDQLVLTATPQPTQRVDRFPTLYADISNRVRNDGRVISGLSLIYNAFARVPARARKGLRHIYRHSPSDLATLEELFDQAHFFDWLRLIADHSFHNSVDEFRVLQRNWLSDLKALGCDISFLHGAEDAISPVDLVEQIAAEMDSATFLRVANAGHFVLSQHFSRLAAHLASLPQGPEVLA